MTPKLSRPSDLVYGIVKRRIILNELTGAKVISQCRGTGSVVLGGRTNMDPLMELGVTRVVGAEHVVAEFKLGYGSVFHDRKA